MEELKTAFKDLAKRTHPDLAEGDGDAEAFVRVRRDYEAALLELSAPRPASRAEAPQPAAGAGAAAGAGGAEGAAAGDVARAADAAGAFAILLKRGFPKLPRHDKEKLRYNYARVRLRSALRARGDGTDGLFDALERELLAGPDPGARGAGSGSAGAALELLGTWARTAVLSPGSSREAAFAALRFDLSRLSPNAALAPAPSSAPGASGRISRTAAALMELLVSGTERTGRGST